MNQKKGRIVLKRSEEDRLLLGHPWIFDNEIESVDWETVPSVFPVADLYSSRKAYLGTVLYSPISKIRCRHLSSQDILPNKEFWIKRIEQAAGYRNRLRMDQACRLVFAEADWLPGLIVDRFASVLSVQILCYGMEVFREDIFSALEETLRPEAIFERSDVDIRSFEGLPERKGLVRGKLPEKILIQENGLKLEVDVINGQKTGHFLDQKKNHALAAGYGTAGTVLDLFCHTGGFALAAAAQGASTVIGVDTSASALEAARRNALVNGLGDKATFIEANVFDYLREQKENRFDMVIIDPPAFAKSRSRLEQGLRGYRDVNWRAMKLVKNGGFFVSCSCSFAVRPEFFEQMLMEAAAEAGKKVRLIQKAGADLDHPGRLGYDESEYLKCFFMQVFDLD